MKFETGTRVVAERSEARASAADLGHICALSRVVEHRASEHVYLSLVAN